MTNLRAMLGDRYDQTIEAACYQIAYSTDDPGNDDRCSKPWHSTRCYGHDSDYPPAAAHRFCSFAVARAEKVLAAVLPDLHAQAWDEGRRIGLTQADYEYGHRLTMPNIANPYQKEIDQ